MTMIEAIPDSAATGRPAPRRRLVSLLQACIRAGVVAYRRRRTRRALDRLDDRALKDIGLARGEWGYERLPRDGW